MRAAVATRRRRGSAASTSWSTTPASARPARSADNPDEQWHRVLDVNVVGMVRVTRAALPHLRASEHAAIVNTCSIAATAGPAAARAVQRRPRAPCTSLTLAMAADHVREGIRVNCVNPGTADTPWVGRLLDAGRRPGRRAGRAGGAPADGPAGHRRGGRRGDRLPRQPAGRRRHRHRRSRSTAACRACARPRS